MPKLTKSFIDRIPLPSPKPDGSANQAIYRDDALTGFGLLVGSGGTRSFFVERRVDGRVKRISVGRYGHLTPAQARIRAQELLGSIALGKDPAAERRARNAASVTLAGALEDYLQSRKELKPGTVANYNKVIRGCLDDWLHLRLRDITKDMVETRHRKIGSRAPARSNNVMRVLRAVFNHAMAKYEDAQGKPLIQANPVDRLSQVRAWYPVVRRTGVIKVHQLRAWYEATLLLNEETSRDLLHVLLFTGLRKNEAATLQWADVDFAEKTLTVEDTKNRDPHVLPLTDRLTEILERRESTSSSAWVFESPVRPGEPIKEPKNAAQRVADLSGVPFTLHDLRRTFITTAEGLDIPHYALKRLLNHRDPNDVTAGYIISGVERLRQPMKQIEAALTAAINREN
ncbi:MAG: tyrosine-type recombinase/integrase [Pseudomonadota bacterium]